MGHSNSMMHAVMIASRLSTIARNETAFAKRRYENARDKAMANNKPETVDPKAWESGYERNVARLAMMILLYFFGNDDGDVSKKENGIFRKVFKKHNKYLNKDDLELMLKYTEKPLRKQELLDYIKDCGFSQTLVDAAIAEIKPHALKTYEYIKLMDDLVKNPN